MKGPCAARSRGQLSGQRRESEVAAPPAVRTADRRTRPERTCRAGQQRLHLDGSGPEESKLPVSATPLPAGPRNLVHSEADSTLAVNSAANRILAICMAQGYSDRTSGSARRIMPMRSFKLGTHRSGITRRNEHCSPGDRHACSLLGSANGGGRLATMRTVSTLTCTIRLNAVTRSSGSSNQPFGSLTIPLRLSLMTR